MAHNADLKIQLSIRDTELFAELIVYLMGLEAQYPYIGIRDKLLELADKHKTNTD